MLTAPPPFVPPTRRSTRHSKSTDYPDPRPSTDYPTQKDQQRVGLSKMSDDVKSQIKC